MKIDPESWPALSRLLDEWLDLPEDLRASWLQTLGPEHADVLPMLQQVIGTHSGVERVGFLETLPPLGVPVLSAAVTNVGNIGPYRLLRQLGKGGMGVVWLAERADGEVKRPVALKVPNLSLHDRTLADRFVRERDILAQLTHPSIARLYDAGVTEQGQPYLAIEYVEGETITSYCDSRQLGLKPRLQLFLQVLGAVQYAHSNLIVHRDLKPANILVTKNGEVRLLDFGIAKLLNEGQASETELTQISGRALTPDYASPEQIAGRTITTASDVYSLGVILYELLTSARPYRLKRGTRSGLEDAILEAEPPRPSETGGPLSRSLKGDLDSIILKALSKAAAQRYASADAFSQDLERFLAGEAVLAQPESAWYRARKFVQRNKLGVGSAIAVIAALSLGLGIAMREAHIAQVQTRSAETAQAFLLDIFRANSNEHADPVKARQTTARELLDSGAKKIEGALKDAPEAKLSLLETLFRMYVDLGLQEQGAALGRNRVALAKSVYGPNHPEVARALIELAADSGESSFAKDRPQLLKEAGSILDRNGDFKSRTRALYYLAMGNAVLDTDVSSSAAYAIRSVNLYQQYPPSRELVWALNLLGQRQEIQDQHVEAIATLSEAARIANLLQGEARRPLPAIYAVLGTAQRKAFDFNAAEKSQRLSLELARTLKGDESVDVLQTEWRLGSFLSQTARPVEGLAFIKKAVDLASRTQGPNESFHTPMVKRAYGVHLLKYGRIEEGLTSLTQAAERLRRGRNRDFDFIDTLAWNVVAETKTGHYRQAEALLKEADVLRAQLGRESPGQIDDLVLARAAFMLAKGQGDDAAKCLRESAVLPASPRDITYNWLDASIAHAGVELAQGRPAAARERAGEVQRRLEERGLAVYFKRWLSEAALVEGKSLLLENRAADALPRLQRAVQLGSEVYDPQRSPELADAKIALATCLVDLGRGGQARAMGSQAKAIHKANKELGEHYRQPLRQLETRLRLY